MSRLLVLSQEILPKTRGMKQIDSTDGEEEASSLDCIAQKEEDSCFRQANKSIECSGAGEEDNC